MEVSLRSGANSGALDLERILLSMVESIAANAALVAGRSLLCFLAVMGSLSLGTGMVGTEPESFTGLHVAIARKNKTEPENKDAGDSEDDEDDDEEDDAEDDQDEDGGEEDSGDEGDGNEGEDDDNDPEVNGEGGSDDDDDGDDDEDDDDEEEEDDDDEEEEEEDEDTPQPPAKKRK